VALAVVTAVIAFAALGGKKSATAPATSSTSAAVQTTVRHGLG
jgi:hypothetical protein